MLSDECIADEVPFEKLPEGWVWVRLNLLIELLSGTDLSAAQYNDKQEGIPYITGASNFDNGQLIENRWTSMPTRISERGDLLFTCKGTVGTMAINPFKQAHIARQVMAIRTVEPSIAAYIQLFLHSMIEGIKSKAKGVIPGIERSTILDALIPLPPLDEQHRIVERINQLMPLVEEYGELEDTREELDAALPDRLRKSVLQMAVQGKLVAQDPTDEPASVLLQRIRKERAKLVAEGKAKFPKGGESVIYTGSDGRHYEKRVDKKGRVLSDECIEKELPFEIPKSWEWARLGSLCDFGKCQNIEYGDVAEGVWNLDLEDIEKDTGIILRKKRKITGISGSTKHIFASGMILYSKLRPYLNKVVIADEDGVCSSEILPLYFPLLDTEYVQITLMEPSFVEYAKECSYGVKMPRLGIDDGKRWLTPLPPLVEQHRIVNKVNELVNILS